MCFLISTYSNYRHIHIPNYTTHSLIHTHTHTHTNIHSHTHTHTHSLIHHINYMPTSTQTHTNWNKYEVGHRPNFTDFPYIALLVCYIKNIWRHLMVCFFCHRLGPHWNVNDVKFMSCCLAQLQSIFVCLIVCLLVFIFSKAWIHFELCISFCDMIYT